MPISSRTLATCSLLVGSTRRAATIWLEALVAVHGLVQAQSGPGVLEHLDEQRLRGAHQRATGDGRGWDAGQGVQVQARLARLGDPPRLRHEDSRLASSWAEPMCLKDRLPWCLVTTLTAVAPDAVV